MSAILKEKIDIKEDFIFNLDRKLLEILLKDRTTNKNIIWAIEDYKIYGENYSSKNEITIESITGKNGNIIKPRTEKSKEEQNIRIRQKAEVFTPSWICNKQNNLIDNDWFSNTDIFNKETDNGWVTNLKKVKFTKKLKKNWQDYVKLTRLEITCGEAPYLTSRYDTVTGEYIEPKDRIGLLDRKLRIISENTKEPQEWIKWAKIAVKNSYGYDWQGDNVLLARENILYAVAEYYEYIFEETLTKDVLIDFAEIISWNIWQMDGLKFVIPNSCTEEKNDENEKGMQIPLFAIISEEEKKDKQLPIEEIKRWEKQCKGCRDNLPYNHTGIYCKIMDWEKNKSFKFVDLVYGVT